jgi:hypothetical protein
MRKINKSPYESHGRTDICALCQERKDEKALKIFMYRNVLWGDEMCINVCRTCENKKEELKDLVKKYWKKKNESRKI